MAPRERGAGPPARHDAAPAESGPGKGVPAVRPPTVPAPVAGPDEGGETACLLHLVCPECGRLADPPGSRPCPRCGGPPAG
ncbi:hypothetical protein [Streptomyces sp. NRRL S-87]|uniref:hypothetical protein n=1 Tax=Streptomyces sp. NRRL S-87 TaxID=1463920 RepID=UPI0004BEF488|nr:hypothetical protein [Streptomyces sp. NRRL S-87]